MGLSRVDPVLGSLPHTQPIIWASWRQLILKNRRWLSCTCPVPSSKYQWVLLLLPVRNEIRGRSSLTPREKNFPLPPRASLAPLQEKPAWGWRPPWEKRWRNPWQDHLNNSNQLSQKLCDPINSLLCRDPNADTVIPMAPKKMLQGTFEDHREESFSVIFVPYRSNRFGPEVRKLL